MAVSVSHYIPPLPRIYINILLISLVASAHYLLKHVIPHLPETHQILLISASSQAMSRPACPRALISDDMFPQAKLFVDIASPFSQYGDAFRYIQGTATQLDHGGRKVVYTAKNGDKSEAVEFHALIIATGSSTPSPLLGLNTNEEVLRTSWATFREALPGAKSIVIVGGGPAGIETAGELGEYLNGRAGWFQSRLTNPKVQITVVTASSEILTALRPAIARIAEGYLAKVGVTIVKNTRVKSVVPEGAGRDDITAKTTIMLEYGKTLEADLYIPATGMSANTGFVEKSLLTADGRIDTNGSTLRVDKAGPRIYAVGDVGSYSRQAIHLIFEAIPVLCANIKRDLLLESGQEIAGDDRIFKEDTREAQLVPIGKSKGVGAVMGYRLPGLLIWALKGRDYWLWTTGALWSGKQWAKEK